MNRRFTDLICASATLLFSLFACKPTAAQSREKISGQKIFVESCSVCHGSDGHGGERGPDIATRREVVLRTDTDLLHIVRDGVEGTAMPGFGFMGAENVSAVVHYLRMLQGLGENSMAPGDSRRGEQLFYGKAECSKCHMVNGRGGFFNSDLGSYGSGRSVEDILRAIVDPDLNLDRRSEAATIVTKNKGSFTGLIRSEDNFSLVLQQTDGSFYSFRKEEVAHVNYSGHSLMPTDYQKRLSSKEIDDLISYLLKTGSSEHTAAQKDDSDEE
jgi:putative heme-binding domain-containing protein